MAPLSGALHPVRALPRGLAPPANTMPPARGGLSGRSVTGRRGRTFSFWREADPFGSPRPTGGSPALEAACPVGMVPPVLRERGRQPRRRRGRLRYPMGEVVARPSPAAAQASACGCAQRADCGTATHPAVFVSGAPRRGRKSLAQGFIPGYPGKEEDASAVGTAAQAGRARSVRSSGAHQARPLAASEARTPPLPTSGGVARPSSAAAQAPACGCVQGLLT